MSLRPFQSDTVAWVAHRFWEDRIPARRFLVADEVGLGKTLVARGVLEKGLQNAKREGRPFRVVYICANAVLAQQNRKRLFRDLRIEQAPCDRLTMLATSLPRADQSIAVVFTPRTSFHLKQRLGMAEERAALLTLCNSAGWRGSETASARNVFLGRKAVAHFDGLVADQQQVQPDRRILQCLRTGAKDLRLRFAALRKSYPRHDSPGDAGAQADFIADLRRRVSHQVLRTLKPDLVILDEFQRFRYLIDDVVEDVSDGESGLDEAEASARELAKELLESQARVLLLSATPFRPFTLDDDDSDHHTDFTKVMGFLLEPPYRDQLHVALHERRLALISGREKQAIAARQTAQSIMGQVVSRHERVSASADRNAMLRVRGADPDDSVPLSSEHVRDAWSWIRLARIIGHRDPLPFWVSSPYGLHFLDGYQFAEQITEHLRTAQGRREIFDTVADRSFALLPSAARLSSYNATPEQHPTLAWLLKETVDADWWRMPWMPPTLPYWSLGGPFEKNSRASKRLVFSAWRAAPKSIASLASYAAEQRSVVALRNVGQRVRQQHNEDGRISPSWWEKAHTKGPSTFQLYDGKKPRWSTLCLIYPSRILARIGAEVAMVKPEPIRPSDALRECEAQIRAALRLVPEGRKGSRVDRRWYGLAPVLLDYYDGGIEPITMESPGKHLGKLPHMLQSSLEIARDVGARPDDLVHVLSRMSLASPAVCARRSLLRCLNNPRDVAEHAARIALSFARYLEKRPHIVAIKADHPRLPLWHGVLMRATEGCLQAVLDEHVHLLAADGMSLDDITSELELSLELRAAKVSATRPPFKRKRRTSGEHFGFRTHFAVRFGAKESTDGDGDESEVERLRRVRSAFNAPWWPFILATTSIGQEGLDFHRWCSAVVHWNLPWNPVDLEQREGRVHRYRNLAVRRNVADRNRATLRNPGALRDPWEALFAAIPGAHRGISPDWLYSGESHVERILPLLPLSEGSTHYQGLCRLLSGYRALLGQPHQEELFAILDQRRRDQLARDAFDLRPAQH